MKDIRWTVLTILVTATLTGCGVHNSVQQAGFAELTPSTSGELPRSIAGPPINLQLPIKDRPGILKAVHTGDHVNVQANSRWRGSTVTMYYLPSSNIRHHGTHLQIASANGVQRIGKFPIDRKTGRWKATWQVGDYPIPPHAPIYMLALSDTREIALVRMNSIN